MPPRARVGDRPKNQLDMLDAAMEETLAGIEASGSGVEASDVVESIPPSPDRPATRTAAPARTAPRRTMEAAPSLERDARGRFLPASSGDEDEAADMADVLVDDQEEAPQPTARRQRAKPAEPEDEYADLLDRYDEEDEEERSYAAADLDADEVEGSDETLGPEGVRESQSDDAQEERRPQKTRKLDRATERLVADRVKAQVGQVLKERDELRAREQQQQQVLAANQAFFRQVLGTEEQLAQLQATALNPNLTLAERNHAAATYQRYLGNRQFAAQYQQGIVFVYQQQQAEDDRKAMASFAQLQALDPKIVGEGNRAKTLVHAYRTGMQAAERALRRKYGERFARMERELETLRGSRDEASVRGGITRRRPNGTLASAQGRRANGRPARPDPMRGAMTYGRGIDPKTRIPYPTDDLLTAIKNGELTLADIGLRAG